MLLPLSTGALRRFATLALVVGALSAGGGSAAYTIATASQAHTGSIPISGPAGLSSSTFGGGGGTGTRPAGVAGGFGSGQAPTGQGASGATGSTSVTTGSTTATSTASLDTLLRATTGTWSAATVGSQTASGYELSSGTSVMAIGGWDGSDPSITLAQFMADVASGKIGYFIVGGRGGAGGQNGASTVASQITSWVTSNYTATTVGGTTVYDLAAS